MLSGLRSLLTGRYESKPITLMSPDEARAWVAEHPQCSRCPASIDPEHDNYTVVNDSEAGVSAHHHQCP